MAPIAATWRRVREPGIPALRRALRLAIAATSGFVVGRYVLDDPQAAVYATLTPIALLGLGHVGGSPAAQARAYALALAAGAFATVVGTLVSDHTPAASLTLFAGAVVASQAGILGSDAAGLARSVLLILIVSAGIPAPDSAIGERLAGAAIGGASVIAVTLLLWPERLDVDYRRRLGAALEPLADAAAALAAGVPPAAALGRARAARTGVRAFALELAERPLGAGRVPAAERRLPPALRELDDLLTEIDPAELGAADRAVLLAESEALAASARVLRDGGAAPPDAAALAHAWDAYDAAGRERLAALITGAAPSAVIARESERVFRLRRMALLAGEVELQAGIASGRAPREAVRSSASRLVGQLQIRLAPGSVLLHDGLRLALGLAAARAIAGAFALEHGFWVVFATLTVTRASAHGTRANAGRAVLGTAIGAVLATALLIAFEAESDIYVLALPLFVFAAFYGSAISFLCGQIGFTLLIVAVFNLIAPPQWTTALIRLEDVAIGAAVGLAIGLAAWPRGPAGQLRRALSRAIGEGGTYARSVVYSLLDPAAAQLEPARLRAATAAQRAEDVFAAYLDESAPSSDALERWSVLLERTHRLWYGASVLSRHALPPPDACPAFAAALRRAADDVAARFRHTGEALHRREPPGAAPARTPAGDLDPAARACVDAAGTGTDRLDGVVHLLGVRAWIVELGRELDGMRDAVAPLAAR